MSPQATADPALDLLVQLPAVPQVDLAHSRQVTHLALAIFDALAGQLRLDPSGRDLLAAAAYWHDSGQSIGEQKHHKHSYALIMALHLPRFGERGKQIIACVARYHRKALPSLTHAGFADLAEPERRQVRELAALLRVADGLDYSHRGLVRLVDAGADRRMATLYVRAPASAETEIRRAYEKADLFRQAFTRDLTILRQGY